MYAFGYSAGFGAIPLQFASPGWIVVFLITFLAFKVNAKRSEMTPQEFILQSSFIGALIGWFTYYLGRAYPENIIAQLPLITIVSLFLLLGERQQPDSARDPFLEQVKGADWCQEFLPFIVLISIIITSIVGQAKFIPTVLRVTSIERPNVDSSAVANELARSLLDLLPSDGPSRPIVFEGHAGVLPVLSPTEYKQLNLQETWLPVPLGLLEEPIDFEKRQEIIHRFVRNNPRSGYILYSLRDSFPDRHTNLMQILSAENNCSLFAKNEEFELIRCDKR